MAYFPLAFSRKRLWRKFMITGALVLFMSFCKYLITNSSTDHPSIEQYAITQCYPKINVGYLKTHKTGSTTVQSIFHRYGLAHGLTFVLPEKSATFPPDQLFKATFVSFLPWHFLGYNMMAQHFRWDREQIESIMPADSVYVTVLREPTEQLRSAFYYIPLDGNQTLQQYVMQQTIPERVSDIMGRNTMLRDLGVPDGQLTDDDVIKRRVYEAENEFHLVMITERMDESLVLLKHLLCWSTEDMVTLRKNARLRSRHVQQDLTLAARTKLRTWLAGDYFLYNHFATIFEQRVQRFGQERMQKELANLREARRRTEQECQFQPIVSKKLSGVFKPYRESAYGYQPGKHSAKCERFAFSAIKYADLLRDIQIKRAKQN